MTPQQQAAMNAAYWRRRTALPMCVSMVLTGGINAGYCIFFPLTHREEDVPLLDAAIERMLTRHIARKI